MSALIAGAMEFKSVLTLVLLMVAWMPDSVLATSCGGHFTPNQRSGIITSPNHPNNYPKNAACVWTIQVNSGYVIRLHFYSPFVLENNYDLLKVSEFQPDGSRRLVKSFTGNQIPETFTSGTSHLELEFTSDGSNQHQGFGLAWESSEGQRECHQILEGLGGDITNYNTDGRDCFSEITVDDGNFIRLEFNWTRADSGNKPLNQDWVEVYDVFGNGSRIRQGQWFRGNASVNAKSFGSRMLVKVQVYDTFDDAGFQARWTAVSDCGGTIAATEGYVMSYDYGENATTTNDVTTNGQTCTWDIRSPDYWVIKLYIEYSQTQWNDSRCGNLQILDNSTRGEQLLPHPKWCSGDVTEDTMTQELTLYSPPIRLVYRPQADDSGTFFVSWRAVCGNRFTESRGHISSPMHGEDYDNDLDCTWLINGLQDHVVHMEFQPLFDVESSNDGLCSYDYVEAFDVSPDGVRSSLGRFCGSQAPPTITSTTKMMEVRFHSDQDKAGKGFSATWNTACGSVFTSHQGSLSSPNYPHPYTHNQHCKWEIRLPDQYVIKLVFESPFVLEGHGLCQTDFLELYDYDKSGGWIKKAKFCGDDVPPLQTSMTSRMMLVFHSDSEKSFPGFKASWDSVLACGQEFHTLEGSLRSPLPSPHLPDVIDCQWQLHVPRNYLINLAFQPPFHLQGQGSCGTDYLEIYDYTDQGERFTKGRWCGNEAPAVQQSVSDRMDIVYHRESNSSQFQGFHVTWESIRPCGEVLYSPNGSLSSPDYPHQYPPRLDCRWEVHAPQGGMVSLTFGDTFDIQAENQGCGYDGLEIYDVLSNGEFTDRGRWCGQHTPPTFFSSTYLIVLFKSDLYARGKGFTAFWDTVPGCGYTYTGPTGYLHSPNYPHQYPVNTQCRWELTAPWGANLTLHFQSSPFDIEISNGCAWDFLQMRLDSQSVGRWCGNTPPPDVVILEGQRLSIEFVSDKSNTGKGFYASWKD